VKSKPRKTISEYLADRIIKNQMRVKFSHAHADFLQETQMSQPIQHPKTEAQIAEQKHAEHVALQTRIAELETRVTALEGKQ
jgi:hypothetical protein